VCSCRIASRSFLFGKDITLVKYCAVQWVDVHDLVKRLSNWNVNGWTTFSLGNQSKHHPTLRISRNRKGHTALQILLALYYIWSSRKREKRLRQLPIATEEESYNFSIYFSLHLRFRESDIHNESERRARTLSGSGFFLPDFESSKKVHETHHKIIIITRSLFYHHYFPVQHYFFRLNCSWSGDSLSLSSNSIIRLILFP